MMMFMKNRLLVGFLALVFVVMLTFVFVHFKITNEKPPSKENSEINYTLIDDGESKEYQLILYDKLMDIPIFLICGLTQQDNNESTGKRKKRKTKRRQKKK